MSVQIRYIPVEQGPGCSPLFTRFNNVDANGSTLFASSPPRKALARSKARARAKAPVVKKK